MISGREGGHIVVLVSTAVHSLTILQTNWHIMIHECVNVTIRQ